MWYADEVKNAQDMHDWLVSRLFPNCKTTISDNLADRWQVDTANGFDYLCKHGLHVLSKAAAHVRSGQVPFCAAVSQDLRSDVLGMPIAEYARCKILDDWAAGNNVNLACFHAALRQNVFTSDALYLAYPETTPIKIPVQTQVQTTPKNQETAAHKSSLASPPTKRKRQKS